MIDKTTDEIIEAIKGSGGIISTIAKRLNVSWHTADKYIKKSKQTKQAITNEREAILDMAEGALYGSIKEGNTQDAKWLLATKGRHRGYGESLEVKNSGTVEISLIKRVIIDPRT